MIETWRHNKLKSKYGQTSSWAIWKEAGLKPKSNTGDMTIFNENICDKLNDRYVFVGLNVSTTPKNEPWKNFHSDSKYQQDYKLRYALKDTKFWGSYITDIIKEYPNVKSSVVRKNLKNNPKKIEENIEKFKNELSILSDKPPVIIAMGNDSYNILNNNLDKKYTITKILHYSYRISKEEYKDKVLSELKNI